MAAVAALVSWTCARLLFLFIEKAMPSSHGIRPYY